jgi:hypothetical protein
MKRRTFYHISLSLPYIALIFSGALTYITAGFDFFASSEPPGILLGSVIFFSFTAVVWGPLYTWMVVVMLFWGRGKSTDEIRNMYLLSPVLLACAMGIPALLINAPHSGALFLWGFLYMNKLDFIIPLVFKDYQQEQVLTAGLVWAFMAGICIVVGYMFVGIVLMIEKAIKQRDFFKEEEDGDISTKPSASALDVADPLREGLEVKL